MRQPQARRAPAGDRRKPLQHRAQRQVLVAQDVALARDAALVCEDVPGGDVAHVDEVEPGVDVRRHPARQKPHDDLAGRRRLRVPRPDRAWSGSRSRRPGRPRPRAALPARRDTSSACRRRSDAPAGFGASRPRAVRRHARRSPRPSWCAPCAARPRPAPPRARCASRPRSPAAPRRGRAATGCTSPRRGRARRNRASPRPAPARRDRRARAPRRGPRGTARRRARARERASRARAARA